MTSKEQTPEFPTEWEQFVKKDQLYFLRKEKLKR